MKIPVVEKNRVEFVKNKVREEYPWMKDISLSLKFNLDEFKIIVVAGTDSFFFGTRRERE